MDKDTKVAVGVAAGFFAVVGTIGYLVATETFAKVACVALGAVGVGVVLAGAVADQKRKEA